jgi:hypothetical protein
MRMIRFLPAYGIGGVLNAEIRKNFEEWFDVFKEQLLFSNNYIHSRVFQKQNS